MHPLLLDDAALLAECEVDTYRASGPGGQKRNKTASAVRLRHRPTGIAASASDSRLQQRNRRLALCRLRQAIAGRYRQPIASPYQIPPALAALIARRPLARDGAEYAAAIGQLLDLLAEQQAVVLATARRLELNSGQLSRLLTEQPWVNRSVNLLRQQYGLRPLSPRR
ncbi:MAG: peptide chain release factor-like protein [Deltaproteobacteria bacterium]|nr:peptide chain release factor-like protein [Deltaproteobacteria bacterium]